MDLSLLNAVLPVFMILAAGYVMHNRGWIDEGLETGIMRLVLNLLFPCLILHNVIGNDVMDHVPSVLVAVGLGVALVVGGIGLCLAAAPVMGLTRGTGKRTFAISTAIQNYGFMAIPVVVELFGEKPLGILFLHAMGVEIATWTVAVAVLSGGSQANWRAVVNGPFIAVISALFLHYTRIGFFIPDSVNKGMEMLGGCAVPMSLFMIGATISHQSKSAEWHLRWPTVAGACVLRLAILPALILALMKFLPVREELRQVMLVQAAMPAAVFPIVLARLYGGHPPTAIQIVLVTTGASLVTIPLIIAVGRMWLGI